MTRRSLAAILAFLLLFGVPAMHTAYTTRIVPDFLTYRYAYAAAAAGDDPYELEALSRARVRDDGHSRISPYLYPPPFLLGMAWTALLPARASYLAFVAIQPLILLGAGAAMRRWFAAPLPLLVGVGCTLTALQRSTESGQINAVVLALIALAGVAAPARSGISLAVASMAKLSPALLLAWLAPVRSRAAFVGASLALALASALLLPSASWHRYLFDVVPRLSRGDFGTETLAVDLTLNHSLADALGRLWPSPDHHSLHPVVSVLTTTFTLGSALAVFVLARRPTDALGSAGLLGALTVTMTLAPAIVWDDHLTFLALPIVVAGTGLWSGRLGRRWRIPLILAYAVLAVPPEWLLPVGWWFPDLARPALDAKTWSALLFGAAGIVIARS